MKKVFRYINTNVLHKVFHLNIASILTKIFAGIITSKAIAIFIGVEGMALIGNFRNFFSAVQSIATLGIYNGLVKYISEFKNNAVQLSKTLSTGYYLCFIATIFTSLLSYYNAEGLNKFLFSSNYNFTYIIKIIAFAIPFYALNAFSFSIMNGFSKYRILMVINIIGQALGLMVTLVLIYQNRIDGALISVIISPSLMFLITLVGIINRKSLVSSIKISRLDFDLIHKFFPFIAMALVTGVAMPLIYILIRNHIMDTLSIKNAGYWEAMNRISDYYLIFVSSLMSLYILPKFSEIESKEEFKKEIIGLYKSVIPVFALSLGVIYLLRPFIVELI